MLTCVSMMTIIFLYLLTLCPFEKCLSIYIAWIIFTLLVACISVSHTCHVEYSMASTCLPIIHSSSLLLTFSTSLCPGGWTLRTTSPEACVLWTPLWFRQWYRWEAMFGVCFSLQCLFMCIVLWCGCLFSSPHGCSSFGCSDLHPAVLKWHQRWYFFSHLVRSRN